MRNLGRWRYLGYGQHLLMVKVQNSSVKEHLCFVFRQDQEEGSLLPLSGFGYLYPCWWIYYLLYF